MWHVTPRRRDEGFSLVELTLVLLILSILMAVGLATFAQLRRVADDKGTQLDLLTAVKVQALERLESGEFTTDVAVLFDLEPTLRYSADGSPAGTVVVRLREDGASLGVCIFAVTDHGDWFAVHHSAEGGDHFARSAPIRCLPADVAAWSTESW